MPFETFEQWLEEQGVSDEEYDFMPTEDQMTLEFAYGEDMACEDDDRNFEDFLAGEYDD